MCKPKQENHSACAHNCLSPLSCTLGVTSYLYYMSTQCCMPLYDGIRHFCCLLLQGLHCCTHSTLCSCYFHWCLHSGNSWRRYVYPTYHSTQACECQLSNVDTYTVLFLLRACMCEGVKESVLSVCQSVCPVKNFEISTFTGLNNCCMR